MSLQRSEMTSRHDDRTSKARKTEQDRRTAYRLVDIRDGGRCRACGCKTFPTSANRNQIREHHHIRGRIGKDAETTGNIVTLCRQDHELRHTKRTLVISGNADQQLTFELDGKVWNG